MNPVEINARTSDVDTSHEAVAGHRTSGKLQAHITLVRAAVRDYPNMTAAELARVCHLEHVETQRRLSDLKRDGLVVQGDKRRCAIKGTMMRVWHLKEQS